jgi:hypothetical protein
VHASSCVNSLQDVELSRMRHEYETDEILIVSLKQQVGEHIPAAEL